MNLGKLKPILYVLTFINLVSLLQAAATTDVLTSQLCNIVTGVRTIVGILALTLFLIGGVLYAVSHFLPTNLEFKKSLTAWSQGMIVGGVIGLVIVLIAQPILGLILNIGTSVNSGTSTVTSIVCP